MSEKNESSLGTPQNLDEEVQILDTDSCLIPKGGDTVIGFRFGKTINIGNYESVRIDFWQARNCTKENKEEVMEDLEKEVLDKMKEYIKKINAKLAQK